MTLQTQQQRLEHLESISIKLDTVIERLVTDVGAHDSAIAALTTVVTRLEERDAMRGRIINVVVPLLVGGAGAIAGHFIR